MWRNDSSWNNDSIKNSEKGQKVKGKQMNVKFNGNSDNNNSNIGIWKSIKSKLLKKKTKIFIICV